MSATSEEERAFEDPAFPSQDDSYFYSGMTMREYFAGQALVALSGHKAIVQRGIPWLVEHAYMVADAMLAEGKKKGNKS